MYASTLARRIVALGLLLSLATVGRAEDATSPRPKQWAEPIRLEGVPNLHRISENLYRSAQPTAEGMKNLQQLGIKTVVNLRSSHSDVALIGETKLEYVAIPMDTWDVPNEAVVRFLRTVTDPKRGPVLFHCQHGADRTGTMCAAYRLVVQGWSKPEAIREMTDGGYGFHSIWINLPRWLNKLDVAKLRQQAGLPDPAKESPPKAAVKTGS